MKNNIKLFIGIIIGIVISGTIVYAATIIAGDITFDNTKTNINADNVQDAIDALYTKANSGSGKTICTYVDSVYGNANDHYSIGTKYSCEVKENTRYNFYVLTNNKESVDLIMEHNITELVGTTRTMNWQTAMDYFRNGEGKVLNWQVPVRLPEAQAIADAVGNTSWKTTQKDYNGWFCFGTGYNQSCGSNSGTLKNDSLTLKNRWLFNYIRECENSGCDNSTSLGAGEAYGYWTSDMVSKQSDTTARAWSVRRNGNLGYNGVSDLTHDGVRPVISVYKSQMN